MLKRLNALLLIAALLSSYCSRFFVCAGFELNQKYIAETLCINKNRPWLHCNGKCYLMNKIKQAEENEKKQAAKDNLSRLDVSFFVEPYYIAFIEPTILQVNKSTFSHYTFQYSNSYIETIFRPPKHAA